MSLELSELRFFLIQDFEKRKKFKPQYSRRAYSRDLGVGLTSLNDFLAGKRSLSFRNIDKIFGYLKKRKRISCSWCGHLHRRDRKLIAGPQSQYICESCVETCADILATNKITHSI